MKEILFYCCTIITIIGFILFMDNFSSLIKVLKSEYETGLGGYATTICALLSGIMIFLGTIGMIALKG